MDMFREPFAVRLHYGVDPSGAGFGETAATEESDMSLINRFHGMTAGTGILLGSLGAAAAQDGPSVQLEGISGSRPAAQPAVLDEAETEPESQDRPTVELTRESRQFVAKRTEEAVVLAGQSSLAFERGLLPLTDYLSQLAMVEYVDVRAADLGGPGQREAVYRRQVERLEDAWQRVAFREPGVRGWRSDALMAELALTEARWKLAEANGDAGAMAVLKSDGEILARAHFEQRARDFRLGFATLPMMAYSAKRSADASLARNLGARTDAALGQNRQRYLDLVLAQTAAFSTIDQGVGRLDRVATARLDVDLASALAADPPALTADNVSQASRGFEDIFSQQMEYYRHGAATLHDVSQTWMAWHDVHQAATLNAEDALDESEVSRRGDALHDLQLLAENVTDRRGRHAGDVTFVQLAGRIDELDELYSEVDPRVEYLP